jgi:hypothetical protein
MLFILQIYATLLNKANQTLLNPCLLNAFLTLMPQVRSEAAIMGKRVLVGVMIRPQMSGEPTMAVT